MLKKENRLKSKRAFDATYKNKNKINSDLVALYAGKLKQDKNCPTRVGFVVSKKVHKRAVKRNRIKRLLRENVRLFLKNNPCSILDDYISLIFYAKNESVCKDFSQIEKNFLNLLDKLANKNF